MTAPSEDPPAAEGEKTPTDAGEAQAQSSDVAPGGPAIQVNSKNAMTEQITEAAPKQFYLDDALWSRVRTTIVAVGTVAWLASAVGYASDPQRFHFSYLVGFMFFVSIALAAGFFVMVQHITGSTWSVTMRRLMEGIMSGVAPAALLFLPVAFGLHDLYHWSHAEAVANDHLLQGKQPYLNEPFFLARAGFLFPDLGCAQPQALRPLIGAGCDWRRQAHLVGAALERPRAFL